MKCVPYGHFKLPINRASIMAITPVANMLRASGITIAQPRVPTGGQIM